MFLEMPNKSELNILLLCQKISKITVVKLNDEPLSLISAN